MHTNGQPEEDDGLLRMSLGEHLEELRVRMGLALAGFAGAFGISLLVGKRFAAFVLSPFREAMVAAGLDLRLQAIQPAEPFLVYIKASLVCAVLLSSPWWLYQIWAFVAGGLHARERRFVHVLVPVCSLLFVGGVLFFLQLVGPWVFRFFMQFDLGISYLAYQPGIGRTADFILALSLVFGVAFQTPVAMVGAEWMGLVSCRTLHRARRFTAVGVFAVAAVVTPPDVVSQVALAIPLYLLFEGGLLACRLRAGRGG